MPSQKQYPFYKKGRFKNTRNELSYRFGITSLFLYVRSLWYAATCHRLALSLHEKNSYLIKDIACNTPLIIPMGHATVFYKYKNHTILTDPIFTSPSFLFKRYTPCTPDPVNLPKVDHVLISHNHRDHCDIPSLAYLYKKNPSIVAHVPLGTKHIVARSGIVHIHEYTWWQNATIDPEVVFTFLPAAHWSQHGCFDHNSSLWGSWMLELGGHIIYFGGDTAYSNHFQAIKECFPVINCALLPIAPCEPKNIMLWTHMNPEQSVQAYYDLGKPLFIPIHWGVFSFGSEPLDGALHTLEDLMEQNNERERLVGNSIGTPIVLPEAYIPQSKSTGARSAYDNMHQ